MIPSPLGWERQEGKKLPYLNKALKQLKRRECRSEYGLVTCSNAQQYCFLKGLALWCTHTKDNAPVCS